MFRFLVIAGIIIASTAFPTLEDEKSDPALSWRVIGGSDAPDGAFPFIISLRDFTGSHSCGGVIVNEYYILTAAHCVTGSIPELFTVVAGSNQLNTSGDRYGVSEIIRYPDYHGDTAENDISLLKLSTPIDFSNPKVSIVTLPREDPAPLTDVILAGWGSIIHPGVSPNNLQYLKLRTIAYDDCKVQLSPSPVFQSQVCTFTATGQGACHGDSGGPLVSLNNTLVGLVSWGVPCARGYPDVFTKVYSYLNWINANTQLK